MATWWAARISVEEDPVASGLSDEARDDLEEAGVPCAITSGTGMSVEVIRPLDIATVQKYIDQRGWDVEWVEHQGDVLPFELAPEE